MSAPPPRCIVGSSTNHQCPEPATCGLLDPDHPTLCERHFVERELIAELDEWHEALFHAHQWVELADHTGNKALSEVAMFARLECEMRIERLEAENRRLWE